MAAVVHVLVGKVVINFLGAREDGIGVINKLNNLISTDRGGIALQLNTISRRGQGHVIW